MTAAKHTNFLYLRVSEEAAGMIEYASKCAMYGPLAVSEGRDRNNLEMLIKELNEAIVALEMIQTEYAAHGMQVDPVVRPETHDDLQKRIMDRFRESMQAGMHAAPTRPNLPASLKPPGW